MSIADDDPSTAPESDSEDDGSRNHASPPVKGLIVLSSALDPGHAGAWLPVAATHGSEALVLGRGASDDGRLRALLVQQRPGQVLPLPPLRNRALSRNQLELRHTPAGLEVVNVGRLPLAVNGEVKREARLATGDILEIGRQLALLASERPARLPGSTAAHEHPFGAPDAFGIVGESPAVWRLRGQIVAAARQRGHVLVLGQSGTGKELTAAALHRLSACRGPFVARNAATLPEPLVDAELFGNAKGYPNAGMPERKGLVGAAHGGTLFLDEIGDLPTAAQPHLLRVLDRGEYQRLGESQPRISEFRLVAATNRPETALRSDFLARFDVRIHVPPLTERREDILFIAAHLLDSGLVPGSERFRHANGLVRWSTTCVRELVRHPYTTHVRELRQLLLQAVERSAGDTLEWPGKSATGNAEPVAPETLDAAKIQAALDANNGSLERTWAELGLSSRYVLSRLVQKHGLVVTRRR